MSSVVLSGDTSGTVTLTVPAVAGSNTVTIPAGTGTVAVQGVSTNIVSGTSVASTSGTSIDFTSIPSWVKRITVMFNGVSRSGTSNSRIVLGTGSTSYTTSGYLSMASSLTTTVGAATASSSGFDLTGDGAADRVVYGTFVIVNITGNTWICNGMLQNGVTANTMLFQAGQIALGAALTAVRVTSSNGTDTFDAGSINILYE
jgi:hypothetical protein